MVDPITTTAVVAAGAAIAKASGADDGQERARLIARVFGPAADGVGAALGRWTDYRLRNVGRIVEAADRRSPGGNAGVPPRIAHQLMENGSYCDDELMAEYLGGLLATARTPSGRDDRAITWTSLITQMSVFEIRAHYLIFTEYIARLREWREENPGADGRNKIQVIYVDTLELATRLHELAPEANPWGLLEHAHTGLQRHDLVSSMLSSYGPTSNLSSNNLIGVPDDIPCENVFYTTPGSAAIELWGHAHGISSYSEDVIGQAQPYIDRPLIPRLQYSQLHVAN